jgi:hypothetical protein
MATNLCELAGHALRVIKDGVADARSSAIQE